MIKQKIVNKKELSLNIGGGEAISTEVELPLDTNILPSINGTTVSLQYQVPTPTSLVFLLPLFIFIYF